MPAKQNAFHPTKKISLLESEVEYLLSKVQLYGLNISVVDATRKNPNQIGINRMLRKEDDSKRNLQILIGHLKEKNDK